jgi:hypothetical protein
VITWKKAHDGAVVESILVCTATYFPEISPAVSELITRMEADWLAEAYGKAEAIFMDINATNGHIMFTWDHRDGGANFYEEGWPTYYLELPALWQESMEHAEGASHFDSQAHMALCDVVGRVLCQAEDSGVEEDYFYYVKFEWSGSARRLIV